MASAPPSIDVDQEVLCPICTDYLTEPVTLDCGHNFCQGCITKYCDTWEPMQMGELVCPVCRVRIQKGNFRRNFQLANIVEKIKLLSLNKRLDDLCKTPHLFCKEDGESVSGLGVGDLEYPLPKARMQRGNFRPNWLANIVEKINKGGNDLCKRHREKLHLFCKEDEELVCLFCERSPEHKCHPVVLKEEAAQEYKTLICGRLEHLRKEREKILVYEAKIREENNSLLKLTETERQKTVERFRQLHQFLEEQETCLLNEIEEMEKEITRRRDEYLDRLSKELSSLEKSMQEMEEKSQQPASELLQDVRSTLQRCQQREAFKNAMAFPPELNRTISNFWVANPILYVEMKEIKDVLSFGRPQKANVTLDPDTAHPSLILSEDRKSVRSGDKPQALPYNPERFNDWPCVLGCEGFTTGRHFWEVDVGREEGWSVGVARKSVERKWCYSLSSEEGIWAVGMLGGKYWAFTSPRYSPLSLSEEPKNIRVTLDYEGGRVSFYDADSGAELYTFSGALFSGETLLPYFCLLEKKTHFSIS